MAAIALAIRLYEVDHGIRPERLTQLVPDYLPDVPRDPLAADGRAISYQPHRDPPILYSVGRDGTDDGGAYLIDSEGYCHRINPGDVPFFLDGVPRRR